MAWRGRGSVFAVLAALAFAPAAFAGTPISPASGAVVTDPRPEFVVTLEAGDTYAAAQVATSGTAGGLGLVDGRVGACGSLAPHVGGHAGTVSRLGDDAVAQRGDQARGLRVLRRRLRVDDDDRGVASPRPDDRPALPVGRGL